jgi:gamma-glutamylcyclotransferase (GGCT)/AIG2-like uncharacterized protein YtfP
MEESNLYAFYGSLRRGMRLYNQFAGSLHYQYSAWLNGYELYSLGNYPYAVKSDNPKSKILVEVFSISDEEAEKEIQEIEKGAGYFSDRVMFGKKSLNIFLYQEPVTNNMRVESGDWVSFFRQ